MCDIGINDNTRTERNVLHSLLLVFNYFLFPSFLFINFIILFVFSICIFYCSFSFLFLFYLYVSFISFLITFLILGIMKEEEKSEWELVFHLFICFVYQLLYALTRFGKEGKVWRWDYEMERTRDTILDRYPPPGLYCRSTRSLFI